MKARSSQDTIKAQVADANPALSPRFTEVRSTTSG